MLLKKTLLLKDKIKLSYDNVIDQIKTDVMAQVNDDLKKVLDENKKLKKQIKDCENKYQLVSQDVITLASAINEIYKGYEVLLYKYFESLKDDKDDIYH